MVAGDQIGRWTLVRREGVRWRCRCACGTERAVYATNLYSGQSRSCGCLRDEVAREPVTHGYRRDGATHPLYSVWKGMRKRCYYRGDKRFAHYGGRGIKVCDRWLGRNGFVNFIADMGDRPQGTTLDRRDNDGDYEPSNCRWATLSEQNGNRNFGRAES